MQYGPFYPSVVVSDNSNGGTNWINPERAKAEDAAGFAGQANCQFSASGKSAWLKATGFDFSSLPDDAVLLGVQIEWKKKSVSPKVVADLASRLVKAGAIDGTDHSAAGNWSYSLTWVGYGGQSNTLGLTVADIKASGFGAAISAKPMVEDGGEASVDAVHITVWTA